MKIVIDGKSLTIEQLYQVASARNKNDVIVEISKDALARMHKANEYVSNISKGDKAVYGINTGFGAFAETKIEKNDLIKLQYNLVRSHCTGVGNYFSKIITRGIMLLRANCLVSGYSGITPEVVQLLVDFLNEHITPIVPEQGSVGASGDLAPLSHIALCLIGEGEVKYEGEEIISNVALKKINKEPAKLGPKDGLALINGTAVMAALGALTLYESEQLIKMVDISAAMTLDAVRGSMTPFYEGISKLKPHPGQLDVTQNFKKLLNGSQILNSHTENCHKVQDPYSLRCIPQVHGACRQTVRHAREVLEIELNAVTDNPLIFPEEDKVVSGGNFHGEAIAMCMDYLAIGLSELNNILERRVEKMMNPTFSDLPPFLTKQSGLNSGLMIAHVTVAALASENKILCHPASVDSIPTSTDKEDHVSMGVTSGRKLVKILKNLKDSLSIELLCNTQALTILEPLQTSTPLQQAYQLIRKHVPPIEEDRAFYKDIKNIVALINSNELLQVVENEIGELL